MNPSHDEIDDARCVLEEAMAATDTPWVAVTRTSLQIVCAALAQQAQPLTDEMIEKHIAGKYDPQEQRNRVDFRMGAKYARSFYRDRIPQQAQPRCEHGGPKWASCLVG